MSILTDTIRKQFKEGDDIRAVSYTHLDVYKRQDVSLADGTLVQRDWYSSFLLYCYDYVTKNIDRDRCISDVYKRQI